MRKDSSLTTPLNICPSPSSPPPPLTTGSNMKKGHYDSITNEIEKLDVDKNMCELQLAALVSEGVMG
jgi:hypothetical protein